LLEPKAIADDAAILALLPFQTDPAQRRSTLDRVNSRIDHLNQADLLGGRGRRSIGIQFGQHQQVGSDIVQANRVRKNDL
jgi:hypothetical protein